MVFIACVNNLDAMIFDVWWLKSTACLYGALPPDSEMQYLSWYRNPADYLYSNKTVFQILG